MRCRHDTASTYILCAAYTILQVHTFHALPTRYCKYVHYMWCLDDNDTNHRFLIIGNAEMCFAGSRLYLLIDPWEEKNLPCSYSSVAGTLSTVYKVRK